MLYTRSMPSSIREDAFALFADLLRFIAVVPKLFDPGTLFHRMSECHSRSEIVRLKDR